MKPYLDTVARRAVDDVELVCSVVRNLLTSYIAPLNQNRHSDCRLSALGGKYDNACILKQLSCSAYQHLDTIRVVAIIIHNAYCRAFHTRSVAERMWIFAGHRVQCCWFQRAWTARIACAAAQLPGGTAALRSFSGTCTSVSATFCSRPRTFTFWLCGPAFLPLLLLFSQFFCKSRACTLPRQSASAFPGSCSPCRRGLGFRQSGDTSCSVFVSTPVLKWEVCKL